MALAHGATALAACGDAKQPVHCNFLWAASMLMGFNPSKQSQLPTSYTTSNSMGIPEIGCAQNPDA